MSDPTPESLSPFNYEGSEPTLETLPPYDLAVIEFRRASSELFEAVRDAIIEWQGREEFDVDLQAIELIDTMRNVLIEVVRNNQDNHQQIIETIRSLIIAHDAERVTQFNELFEEEPLEDIEEEHVDAAIARALKINGPGEEFVDSICDDYETWLLYDLNLLERLAEQKLSYDDTKRRAIVDSFYQSLIKRRAAWPDFDPQNPDHKRIMDRKIFSDVRQTLTELGIRIGGNVTISECRVINNGERFLPLLAGTIATGELKGLANGRVYDYDEEKNDGEPVLTHQSGLYLTLVNPKLSDIVGNDISLKAKFDTGAISFPIMNDGIHLTAEDFNLN